MDGSASFGYWIRRRRKALDLTQDELARRVGCSEVTIRKIEADERRPSRQIAERLADLLEIAPLARAAFLKAARAELSADRLAAPTSHVDQAPRAAPATNLPAPPTLLIGRAQELARVGGILRRAEVRLLTLTGPGGVGKTRMAIALASALAGEFADGVCFVALAPIRDTGLAPSTIARALGVKESGGLPLLEIIKTYLHDRHVLLLLDNFEQVLAAAPLIAELLATAPALKVLVTSRARLHLSGEYEFPVPALALPSSPPGSRSHSGERESEGVRENLAQYAAVDLFIQRARAVRPNFMLTDANAPVVAAICARLDGLPLAIELAAARGKLFAPQALLARLNQRLTALTGGARDLPQRQQTLRGTLDWSYDLLHAGEQTLFARLGVFVGGCAIDAVEAVCNTGGDLAVYTLDWLESLADKSLLQEEEGLDGEPRFSMLETIREYALERLAASGESEAGRQTHAAYYLALAEQAEPELTGPRQVEWLDRLEREHDNLRAALSWALEGGEPEIALRLGGALWRFWYVHGHMSEGRRWLDQILALPAPVALSLRAKSTHGAGSLANLQNDYGRGIELFEENLALYHELRDTAGIARTLLGLGWAAMDQGDYTRAATLFEESLALYRDLGDRQGIASTLSNLGSIAYEQGDNVRAAVLHEESLALSRKLEDQRGIALSLSNLGQTLYAQGDFARATMFLEESLAMFRQAGDRYGIAHSLSNLASVTHDQGDDRRARASYAESLKLFWEFGDRRGVAECLERLARVARALDDPRQAARLYAAAEGLRNAIGAPLEPAQRSDYDSSVVMLRTQLGAIVFAAAWAAGRALPLEQAIAEALQRTDPGAIQATVERGASGNRSGTPTVS